MKKIYPLLSLLFIVVSSYSQDVLTGIKAATIAPGSETVRTSRYSHIPDFIRFNSGSEITPDQVVSYLRQHFQMDASMGFILLSATPDRLGLTHYRYQQTCNNIPLQGSMYIVHAKNGRVVSMNGMIFPSLSAAPAAGISESNALQDALEFVNASVYRWELSQDEALLKMMTKNPEATWYPKGILTYSVDNGNYSGANYRLTYRFDIYASKPLSRQFVYVDAQTGKVNFALNRIHDNNPSYGNAVTAYSGNQTIVTDSEAVNRFYLRDTLRGNGVVTLNMQHSTNDYANASNFQDADNNWNNTGVQQDQYATDAHFGLEKTYDLYETVYNRNSLDDDGLELYAYVHYDYNYVNAFWDGTAMNFGDGDNNQGITPLTTLDITGHEMTHGLTQYTCDLNYFGESGGLNESFSDLAGEMVERLGKGDNDWLIGAEIGVIIRYFSNPALDGASASTYGDNNWTNNTDVHYWSGPQNHWFYILSVGDTGTNDLGTPYSVAGIGMDDAHAIAYRSQTVYLTPSSQYSDARFYAIQAAKDLFGGCSPQDISCTNAWHAVGVGNPFVAAVISDFTASTTSLCSLNNTVHFTNLSVNGENFEWDFGDGTTSTDINPAHTYTGEGTYSVSLFVDGGTCGEDSSLQVNYITVALPDIPTAFDTSTCTYSPAVLTGLATGTITWYEDPVGGIPIGSGSPFFTPPVTATTIFYAENDVVSPPQAADPITNNFGTGGYFTFTNPHYVIFDAYDNFLLQSVTVYANQSGVRTIELLDNGGNLLNELTINIAIGTVVVPLNFEVAAGTGYQLGLQDGSMSNLYRNQTGANFPYTLAGVLSLTGNDIPDQDHYYYFYNWQVQKTPCTSLRVPVKVDVYPTPAALFSFDAIGPQVTFTNGSTGGATSYEWDFGDGNTSTLANPTHQYSSLDDYTVQLIACIGDCCDTTTQLVALLTGVPSVSITDILSVSPNPFDNYIQVNYVGANASFVTIELRDVLGRLLDSETKNFLSGNQVMKLPTDQLSSGIYFINVESTKGSKTFKVVKNR